MKPALIGFALILACSARCAEAGEITSTCRTLAEPIHLAATEHLVPVLLLTALAFAESSCNPNAVHRRTGAVGLFQILPAGSASLGYTAEELKEPNLNSCLAATYLATWHRRCGSWRGAVEVYGGRQHCKVRSKQGAKIIAIWQRLEREETPRS